MKVQSIAENTDNKIVLKDILKKCFSKKPELNLIDQFKISSIGKTKPINIGTKQTRKNNKNKTMK